MRKIYRIKLSSEERKQLNSLLKARSIAANKVIKARSLLLADESDKGSAYTDLEIMEATGIKPATLTRLRTRVCEVGPLEALERKKQENPSRVSKITGEVEAKLTALACSGAPKGYQRWTLHLLAVKLVKLEVVDSISHEAVRTTLKKMKLNLG
ncbi:MAG: helix-turn-helix domain-containing protein [Nitrospirota bacterium]|nr:helix-turn-helix domain-containing protein [Nitrospirota bacterium]